MTGSVFDDVPILGQAVQIAPEPRLWAVLAPGGKIELPDGITLADAIAGLWAEQAEHPEQTPPGFLGMMALLEGRLMAERFGKLGAMIDGQPV